jgi:hypothetical protein
LTGVKGLKALILENKVERESAEKAIESGKINVDQLEKEILTNERAVHMLTKLRESMKEVCQMYSVYDQFVQSIADDPRWAQCGTTSRFHNFFKLIIF